MTKRMLIDAAHPEETRVVVLDGNRLEDFDYESSTRQTLKGNIYLGKITRVEPSLQAAFIEYGGNRHGFLPFSDIHPDYYRIPIADREALIAQEAEYAAEEQNGFDGAHDDTSHHDGAHDDGGHDDRHHDDGHHDDGHHDDDGHDDRAHDARPSEHDARSSDKGHEDEGHEDEGHEVDGDDRPHNVAAENYSERVTLESSGADHHDDAQDEAREDEPRDNEPRYDVAHDGGGHDHGAHDHGDHSADSHDGDGERAHDYETRGGESHESEEHSREAHPTHREESNGIETVGGDEYEPPRARQRSRRSYKIQEVIKRRQIVLVQVTKEERGNKGAALTTYISLAGRYCVLMPNAIRGGGISRKITDIKDRRRLKDVIDSLDLAQGMAVILRTAGMERSKAEIRRDYEFLTRVWDEVREKTFDSRAPALIYEEANLIKRTIRDVYSRDIDEVLVEGEEAYKTAKTFMRALMPSHARRVQLYKDRSVHLFPSLQVESQLDALHASTVRLKSGGYIVINPTEALVAVDVNSGRATRERHIEETALRTNLEAASEIARQLRLRDLAGLIVIDFIDMEDRRNNAAVERRLKEAMRLDRARVQLGRISQLGLLELSRQRLRPSLLETSMQMCPHCEGRGYVRTAHSTALHVFRAIEEEAVRRRSAEIAVYLPVDVALFILNTKRDALVEMEQQQGMRVLLERDDSLISPAYRIEQRKAMPKEEEVRRIADAEAVARTQIPLEADDEDGVDDEEAAEAPARAAAPTPTIGAEAPAGDDDRPRRRRRGRRGGRRRGRGREEGSEEAGAEGWEASSDEQGEQDVDDEGVEGEAATEEQPSGRSGRSRRGRRRRSHGDGSTRQDARADGADQMTSELPPPDLVDPTMVTGQSEQSIVSEPAPATSELPPPDLVDPSLDERAMEQAPDRLSSWQTPETTETPSATEPANELVARQPEATQPEPVADPAPQAEPVDDRVSANGETAGVEPANKGQTSSNGEDAARDHLPPPEPAVARAPRRGWWQRLIE